MNYILVAYKPHSACWSMGHRIEDYSQDYNIHDNLTLDELNQLMAQYKADNEFMESQEARYSLTVIRGEVLFNEEEIGYIPEMLSAILPLIDSKIQSKKEQFKKVEAEAMERMKQAQEQKERKQLDELLAKYGQ